MSDSIKHECGIALLRLLKPQQYYIDKYKRSNYPIEKMFLLMQKQQNRGQDGAGLVSLKLDMPPEIQSINRIRRNDAQPIQSIFNYVEKKYIEYVNSRKIAGDFTDFTAQRLKENVDFFGEIFLGHLRYGTFGGNDIKYCHPFVRSNNWLTKNLVLAGNFNLTNVSELFEKLIELGQHPVMKSDTTIVIEKIGHFLDVENKRLYDKIKKTGKCKSPIDIYKIIEKELNVVDILKKAVKYWDGGFTIAGLIGYGDCFVMRDVYGIRPAFYYASDEIVAVTSERPVIQTAFDIPFEEIKELQPGHALIIKKSGKISLESIISFQEPKKCSFERIYFSRGNDKEIYSERKKLGKELAKLLFPKIKEDIQNTVISYVPNTAETSFYGLCNELNHFLNQQKQEILLSKKDILSSNQIEILLNQKIRMEKVAVKDQKIRTFITEGKYRDRLVVNAYDVTYGIIKPEDTLVVIDDSIVRGTTLKQSILAILGRLKPKKVIILSSAPQIRYPDCYGIDMSEIGKMIAFQATIALLKELNKEKIIEEIYHQCKKSIIEQDNTKNYVKGIYKSFDIQTISYKIARLLKPENFDSELEIIFQSIEGLRASCLDNTGDWYFTGDYPTPGGNRVVNQSFINWYEKVDKRAY